MFSADRSVGTKEYGKPEIYKNLSWSTCFQLTEAWEQKYGKPEIYKNFEKLRLKFEGKFVEMSK